MNVYKYYRMYTQNTKLYTNNLNPDVVTWTIFTLYYYELEVESIWPDSQRDTQLAGLHSTHHTSLDHTPRILFLGEN